ncbi:MAG TPA: glycosyltransferase family 4 protein [Actinomycetota bacterium]|nr:glycosyltransferase family 4 protein [Actinomycetota bacterium]
MRVALLTGIFPPDVGGPATHASDLAAAFEAAGHRVHVVAATDKPDLVSTADVTRFPRRWSWPRRQAAIALWLRRHRRDYDVVYATGLHLAATLGGRLARRPVVVKIVGDPAWERGRRLELTGSDFEGFQEESSRSPRLRLMQKTRDWTVGSAAAVVVPSEYLKGIVSGWADREIRVIHNGVVLPPELRAAPEAPGEERVALYVGRLVPHKRIDILIEAIAAAPGFRLQIVGEGPDLDRLETCVADQDVEDRVEFLGALDHDEVMKRMLGADVLVSASAYEGLPHVAIEAMACGLPVITTPVGGMVEVVVDGDNGRLIHDATPQSFATALRELIEAPERLVALRNGAAARSTDWRFEATASKVEELLQLVLGTTKPRAVFLAKTSLPRPLRPDQVDKIAILRRHLDPVLIGVGPPRRGWEEGAHVVVSRPLRPAALGGVLFYLRAPWTALRYSRGYRSAIVCQSPLEGAGAIIATRLRRRRHRPAVIVEVHGDWRTAGRLYGHPSRKLVAPVADAVSAWAVRRADLVRVIGDYTQNLVNEIGYGGPVIRYTAFSDFSTFMRPVVDPPDSPRVAFVGVLEPYKGIDVLIEAWAEVVRRIPGARLTVVGDGPMRPRLEKRIGELGISESVDLRGRIPRAEIADVFDSAAAAVLPSRSEGLGLVVLEAMARARPVVASNVGGIPEMVEHERTGLLVPPHDEKGLAAALIRTLEDPTRAREMGALARDAVTTRDPARDFAEGVRAMATWIGSR